MSMDDSDSTGSGTYQINLFHTVNFVDKVESGQTPPSRTVLHNNIFGDPEPGFIYLTHAHVWSVANKQGESVAVQLRSIGPSGANVLWTWVDSEATTNGIITTHVSLSGMNIKLARDEQWQLFLLENNVTSKNNFVGFCSTFVWTVTE